MARKLSDDTSIKGSFQASGYAVNPEAPSIAKQARKQRNLRILVRVMVFVVTPIIGLGLLGRITARLARAAGCAVVALEASPTALERHEPSVDLALVDEGDATTEAVVDWARGRGVDAVLGEDVGAREQHAGVAGPRDADDLAVDCGGRSRDSRREVVRREVGVVGDERVERQQRAGRRIQN